jgi:glutamyl-Q tRNA(Asp) synthetase
VYVGRFAPSPTGPLHMGSLLTALASFLDARSNHGQWLLRIEDIDQARIQPNASTSILKSLHAHGLFWDGPVTTQHSRKIDYNVPLQSLIDSNKLFYCYCTRRDLKLFTVYPGTCRLNHYSDISCDIDSPFSIRINTSNSTHIVFSDLIQSDQHFDLNTLGGDFIIIRKDMVHAYNFVVCHDDYLHNISHIIRGYDLIDTTAQHIFLQNALNYPTPQYGHIPILVNQDGYKLSKQYGAPPINDNTAPQNLLKCLGFLNQPLPPTWKTTSDILKWAIDHWCIQNLSLSKKIYM